MKGSDGIKSAFVGLKTELLKKQEEVKRIKDQIDKNVEPVLKQKKHVVAKKSNKGVEKRNLKDLNNKFEDDTDVLTKSRDVLEAKARLYDKLNNEYFSGTSKKNTQYLIDFDAKHELSVQIQESYSDKNHPTAEAEILDLSNSSDQESDWIEFEDTLGRTQKCLKKHIKEMRAKDLELALSLQPPTPPQPTQQLLSMDMQRELNRQKWEEQEAALIGKRNVYYQDVLFDEARAHGVAYFQFSTNEEERLRQQEALKHLRNETVEEQQSVEALHSRRQHQLKVRLAAACKRRQERLGLPYVEVESQVPEMTTSRCEEPSKDDFKITDMEKNISKIASVRPWDIGKQGAGSVLSQEEWVEKKREERVEEFAPLDSHQKSVDVMKSINKRIKVNNRFCSKKAEGKDRNIYNYANIKDDLGDSAEGCVNLKHFNLSVQSNNEQSNLYSLLRNKTDYNLNQTHETINITINSSTSSEEVRLTSTDKEVLADTKKLYEHTNSKKDCAIVNETYEGIETPKQNQVFHNKTCSINYLPVDPSASLDQSTKNLRNTKRKWAETAPPATMEYFAGTLNSNSKRKTEKVDLAESLSAGLHYLKALTEKKDMSRVKGLLDIV